MNDIITFFADKIHYYLKDVWCEIWTLLIVGHFKSVEFLQMMSLKPRNKNETLLSFYDDNLEILVIQTHSQNGYLWHFLWFGKAYQPDTHLKNDRNRIMHNQYPCLPVISFNDNIMLFSYKRLVYKRQRKIVNNGKYR